MAVKTALLRLLQKALKSLAHYSQLPIYNLAGLRPSPFQLLDPPLKPVTLTDISYVWSTHAPELLWLHTLT